MVSSIYFSRASIIASSLMVLVVSTSFVSGVTSEKACAIIDGPRVRANFTFEQTIYGVGINGFIQSGLCSPGNYTYHIHENRIPEGGNCQDAGKHFDPLPTSTNSADGKHRELGDLSGKFGTILVRDTENKPIPPFKYVDPSLNLTGTNNIVGRSVVIHNPDGTRLACANINLIDTPSTPPSTTVQTDNPSISEVNPPGTATETPYASTPNIVQNPPTPSTETVDVYEPSTTATGETTTTTTTEDIPVPPNTATETPCTSTSNAIYSTNSKADY
ncbi:superoxide dismutase [Syncephalis plumigaleata]|nr:superoxide dismutase [Syncephalis plumigaleata]